METNPNPTQPSHIILFFDERNKFITKVAVSDCLDADVRGSR